MDWTAALLIASVASVALALVSAAMVPPILARLPEDHFTQPPAPRRFRWAWRLAGVTLVLLGVIMLFTPGQGTLTILAGASLIDFPGRRAMITRLLRRPAVQRATTALRARYGAPPLRLPADEEEIPDD